MTSNSLNLGYTFLVAFLAFLGTFLATLLVGLLRNRLSRTEQRRNFSVYVRLELEAIQSTLDRIKTSYENQRYFEYRLIDVLYTSLARLETSRKDSVLVGNFEVQEQYLSLLTDLSVFTSDIRSIEALKDTKTDAAAKDPSNKSLQDDLKASLKWVKEKSTDKLTEFVDFKRRISDTIKALPDRPH